MMDVNDCTAIISGRRKVFMKKNVWLYIALLLVACFAGFQAVNNLTATKAEVGESQGLDAKGLEKIVDRANSGQKENQQMSKHPHLH